MDTDAQTVTSKGKHDLMMKSEGKSRTGFFKQAKKSYPMFPFSEEKLKWDDYGEIIRPEDYTIIDVPQTDEDSSAENVKKQDSAIQDLSEVPTKCVAATVTLDINANIQYIDFEGRSDGESIKKILSQIKPRQLILVRATTEATEALAEYCRKNEGVVQGKIFLPHIGEVVDVTRESHIFQVRLRDYVVSALEFAKAKETELAWIDGILDMSRGKVDTRAMYDTEEGELTEEKARKIQDGVLNGEEDPMEVVPTVEALPHNQFVGHKAVFINEPKLSDFKLVLLQEGISAEFIAGVLICNNNVAVRRNEAGRIQLEGTICEDFFKIRQILYSQYAIV